MSEKESTQPTSLIMMDPETGGSDPFPNENWGQFVSAILGYFPRTRGHVLLLTEFIRNNYSGRLVALLFQVAIIVLGILLTVYPLDQLIGLLILLNTDWEFWSVTAFVTLPYFVFYLVDRLLLLYFGVVEGIQRAVQFVFLGWKAIIKNNIEVQMDNRTKLILLIGGICFGIGVSVFPEISSGKLLLQNLIGGGEQLNVSVSTNHSNMTMQTSLSGAFTLRQIIFGILATSKCFNFILQFISHGALMLVLANVLRKNTSPTNEISAEQCNAFTNLLKVYEKFTKVVRLWVRIYCWVLWGYDKLIESFPDNQQALDLSGIRYCLGILAMLLVYCFMNCLK